MPSDSQPPGGGPPSAEPRLRILSLTTVFPRPDEPDLGLFIQSRLQHIAEQAEVRVVSPIPLLDLANPKGRWLGRRIAGWRPAAGRLQAIYPRWLYPPKFGGFNGLLLALRLLPFVRRLRREFPFDVIDAHFGHPEAAAAALLARACGTPCTVTLRGNETMHGRHSMRRRWMAWGLRRAGRVITVSQRLRDYAVSLGVSPERACVIPNGVNDDVYFPHDRLECRARHSIPPDALVVLSAGYLIERKGHHHVMQALAAIAAEYPNLRLLIAGAPGREGVFHEQLHSLVGELNLGPLVHFLGWTPPAVLAELMSAVDVFCLASSREGWPNVVHEAMSCGAPVVATDVGAVPEMIPSEEFGIVVPAGDVPALTAALRTALARTWNRERIAAWARSRSWSQVAAESLREMRNVVFNQAPASH